MPLLLSLEVPLPPSHPQLCWFAKSFVLSQVPTVSSESGVLCCCAKFSSSVALPDAQLNHLKDSTDCSSGPDPKIHMVIFKIYRDSAIFIFCL